MSSRALRKLQSSSDLPSPQDEEADDSPIHHARNKSGANAFSLLGNDSCSESEVKEDDDQESSRTEAQPANNRKKKKRKKKTGKKMVTRSSEDNLDLDEVEASLKWVEDRLGPVPDQAQPQPDAPHPLREVLTVENKHLNPDNEMRRKFGSRVVQTENQSRQRKQRGRTLLRGSVLITPKPSWPNASRNGLSMRSLEMEREGQWFTWDHSPQYQTVQMEFLRAVDSMNPERIMKILNSHPMHIDSMLQLSEICKMGDDSAMAADLIERTLYAFEASFHPCFNLSSGTSRLEYRRQENRSFFLALFRHVHYVASRSCYRTALELTKILLSLDPEEDPLAAILMVDFFALRSCEYQWLIDLCRIWEPQRNLSQLPNMAYSLALATFHLSLRDESLSATADQLLQDALIEFPDVLIPLLDKCSIDADRTVSTHPYFLDTRETTATLASLCTLYVERTHHCWKEPEVLPWLEKNCSQALQVIQLKGAKVEKSAVHRRTRYQGLPLNINRHVVISEISAAVAKLPANLSRAAVVSWDPLPPPNSINTYEPPPRQPTVLDDRSSLGLFFHSLLPTFNPEEPLPDGAIGGQLERPAAGGDLRTSVHSLLGAMRELLGNIEVVEALVEAGDEASDDDAQPGEWD